MAAIPPAGSIQVEIPNERIAQFNYAFRTNGTVVINHEIYKVWPIDTQQGEDGIKYYTAIVLSATTPNTFTMANDDTRTITSPKPVNRLYTYEVFNFAGKKQTVRANGVYFSDNGDLVFTDVDINTMPVYGQASGQWSRFYMIDPETGEPTHTDIATYDRLRGAS